MTGQKLEPPEESRQVELASGRADPRLARNLGVIQCSAEGWSRARIAAELGCSLATIDRVLRRHREGGDPCGAPARTRGRPARVTKDYLSELRRVARLSPRTLGYRFVAWTGDRLARHLAENTSITLSGRQVRRLVRTFEVGKPSIRTNESSDRRNEHAQSLPPPPGPTPLASGDKTATASDRVRKAPRYRLHRPSGQAVVTLDGKDRYLGRHGTPASQRKYWRLLLKWLADEAPNGQIPWPPEETISNLIYHRWRGELRWTFDECKRYQTRRGRKEMLSRRKESLSRKKQLLRDLRTAHGMEPVSNLDRRMIRGLGKIWQERGEDSETRKRNERILIVQLIDFLTHAYNRQFDSTQRTGPSQGA